MSDKPRTIAIIQARIGSTRLPRKVLLDIGGEPMLVRVVERARRAATLDGVIVATTTEVEAGAIEKLCQERGYPVYCGDLHDVLDRYYQAARLAEAQIVVRITADCPVVDPQVVDETLHAFQATGADFATNRLPPPWGRTYPIGLDTEICTFTGLERAWREADQAYQREHVMPFFYEGVPAQALQARHGPGHGHGTSYVCQGTSPRGFRVALLHHEPDYGALRWTVDTAEDLELLRQIYARFGGRDEFSWKDVLALFDREPELAQINAEVKHKGMLDAEKKAP